MAFELKPECRAAFEAQLRADADQTLRDDGCLRMEVLHPRCVANRIVLSELWRDDALIAAHRAKPRHSHAWQTPLIHSKRAMLCDVMASTELGCGRCIEDRPTTPQFAHLSKGNS